MDVYVPLGRNPRTLTTTRTLLPVMLLPLTELPPEVLASMDRGEGMCVGMLTMTGVGGALLPSLSLDRNEALEACDLRSWRPG